MAVNVQLDKSGEHLLYSLNSKRVYAMHLSKGKVADHLPRVARELMGLFRPEENYRVGGLIEVKQGDRSDQEQRDLQLNAVLTDLGAQVEQETAYLPVAASGDLRLVQ